MLLYKNLSKYYQKLILDDDYEKWLCYLLDKLKSKLSFGVGYDVGCGTGVFTRKLKSANFDVTGVDVSQEMLQVAKEVTASEKMNINYLLADMRKLKSFQKLDFITVVNDGLNYVKGDDVKRTFHNFKSLLKSGGVLMFDVSSKHKFKNVLSNNMFGDDGDDLSYIWLSEYDDSEQKITMNLSFFEKQGDVYKRYNEEQVQYAHETDFLKNSLISEGFEIVSITGNFGQELTETEDRILFFAIKK